MKVLRVRVWKTKERKKIRWTWREVGDEKTFGVGGLWQLAGRGKGWQAYRSGREAWLTADEAVTRDESRRDAARTEKLPLLPRQLSLSLSLSLSTGSGETKGGAGGRRFNRRRRVRRCCCVRRWVADAVSGVAVNAARNGVEGNVDKNLSFPPSLSLSLLALGVAGRRDITINYPTPLLLPLLPLSSDSAVPRNNDETFLLFGHTFLVRQNVQTYLSKVKI